MSRIELKGSPDGSTPIDAFHPLGAERVQRQREHERLRHRLDGEGHPGVADLVDVAVEGGEADAEMIGIGLAEFGNVVGDRAAGLGEELGMAMVEEPQQRRLGAGPMAGLLERGRLRDIHDLSCRRCLREADFTSLQRALKPAQAPLFAAVAARNEARSGLDDRERLAFGDDVVDLDQDRFQLAGRGRSHRDFHLHGFDERDVVAIADAGAGFDRKRANAPGDFGHDLDIWHSILRAAAAHWHTGYMRRIGQVPTAFVVARRLPEVA